MINGLTLSDSLFAGGCDPGDTLIIDDDDYQINFTQGTECTIDVMASRIVCGAGLYGNLWFA